LANAVGPPACLVLLLYFLRLTQTPAEVFFHLGAMTQAVADQVVDIRQGNGWVLLGDFFRDRALVKGQ